MLNYPWCIDLTVFTSVFVDLALTFIADNAAGLDGYFSTTRMDV